MCNGSCINFGVEQLPKELIYGKNVLEVGARNVNGTVRDKLLSLEPASYLGVDIEGGACVDKICNVYSLVQEFGENSFDVVVSTEMMEHVADWKGAINNMKKVLRPNGIIVITTRSFGAGMHDYPEDHWRFEIDDMINIFSDFVDVVVQKDPEADGVFIKGKKPEGWSMKDISRIALYNIMSDQRQVY